MQILGLIGIIVGLTLFFVGRSLHRYIPPDYNEEDRESVVNALLHTGKMISGLGVFFIIVGAVCMSAAGFMM